MTGAWTGTFIRTGTSDQGEAHFDLNQKGDTVTGKAGPGLDRLVDISNGKITTVKGVTSLTFEATQPNGVVLKFDLNVVEGRLKGKATGEQNGEKREAAVDAGRKK